MKKHFDYDSLSPLYASMRDGNNDILGLNVHYI
jgi:hypothetical protein